MMDIQSWKQVGTSGGLQSTDGRQSAVFVSCGGNPLVSGEFNIHDPKDVGDGFPSRARMLVIAGQEFGHYADIIRNAKGHKVARHTADISGLKATDEAHHARQYDLRYGHIFPDAALSTQAYMSINSTDFNGNQVYLSRLGYTGEDGFEISIAAEDAPELWELLLKKDVKPIGLAARDSLRLEMGYPLYGHDLDDTTSPIEADLAWVIRKKDTNFIGSTRITKEREQGVKRKRVGITLLERGVAREGAEISLNGQIIGALTSGGMSPLLKRAIGQGYIIAEAAQKAQIVDVIIRGKSLKAEITSPVFLKPKTKTGV
jgi:hypothetical protein